MDIERRNADLFVGREREMAELGAALDEAIAGHGQLIMLAGEPGIGKTRIARELAGHAGAKGARILWGWCYEGEGAPSYWPWVQPIRGYVQQCSPEQLQREIGPGAAAIAEIIPEVRQKLPSLEPAPVLEPEQARFRLFDSICTFLKNMSHNQALVVVLDDLHWADKQSLLLLEFLARQMGDSHIMVLGCYRDVDVARHHPLFETLGQLSREPAFQRQLLRGLSQQETERFIELATSETATGFKPSQQMIESVYAHTEGNPFFMSEVIRLLREQGDLNWERVDESGGIPIPEGVREVIGRRLNRLSDLCNETLTTASIIGREFDFSLIQALDQESLEDQLLEAIDQAQAAHLIEELPGGAERYRFSHALVQQTLSEELSVSRRVRLHSRIAEALEDLYGEEVEAHAGELAHHFAEAETALGPGKLVFYSRLAGERALSSYAHEEAIEYFQRALAAKEGQRMDADTAALEFGLGRAQLSTLQVHQLAEAVSTLGRAFSYYSESGDVDSAVAVVNYPGYEVARQPGMRELIAGALKLVPPNSHQAGRLLTRYAISLNEVGGNEAQIQQYIEDALVIARREGDKALELRTLAFAGAYFSNHLKYDESLQKCQQAIDLASQVDDPRTEVQVRYHVLTAQLTSGDLEGAKRQIGPMLSAAERLRDPFWLSSALWKAEIVSRLEGDWDTARQHANRGLAAAPEYPNLLADCVLLECESGQFLETETYLGRLRSSIRRSIDYGTTAMVIAVISRICKEFDHNETAQSMAQQVLESTTRTIETGRARTALALLAVAQGDVAGAEEQYASMEPRRGSLIIFAISADRLLGLLAQTMGCLDKAVVHFDEALAFCRKAGYGPELAWTCCDYAEMLLLGAGAKPAPPFIRRRGQSLLDEALAISIELGMRPLMERAAALQERAEAQPVRTPAYPDGLTQREVEVLLLIATGKTDREIGKELTISIKTVGNHVSSILNKTGAANRTEAATYAAQRDLA